MNWPRSLAVRSWEPEMRETAEILTKARGEIERRGLFKGNYAPLKNSDSCQVCGYGAINLVTGKSAFDCDGPGGVGARLALCAALGGLLYPEWQDRDWRTLTEVLEVFDRAIANQSSPSTASQGA
jgi:hypothetical protein